MEKLIITTFILSITFISLLIRYSEYLGLQDIPNERSAHKKIKPRSAGIGFVASVLISLLIFEYDHVLKYYYVYISILFVTLVGFYDDKFNISHRYKFLALLLTAVFVSYHGITIDSLGTYFGYTINLPIWFAAAFSIFAIVGFTNALNLMDGLDGLAGALSLVMLLSFFTVGLVHDDEFMMTLSGTFIITIVAFLIFNWHPAKIFMGDSGSLSLGFVISILSVQSLEYMAPAAVLFIVGLPLIDTFMVMRRRLQRGQSPFTADKNHLHHFMYKTKVDVKISVMMLIYDSVGFVNYRLSTKRRRPNTLFSLVRTPYIYIFSPF